MTELVIMIIVWSVVIAAALLAEFLIYNLVSTWFAVGGIAGLISAVCKIAYYWQILVFVGVSFLFLLSLRPICVKFMKNKTVPTNLDVNLGKKFKLLKPVAEGVSEIKIHDVVWTVECGDALAVDALVEIVGMQGNRYIVKEAK